MAKILLSHLSMELNRHVDVTILLPDALFLGQKKVADVPVLYLLHGLSGSHEAYTRFTSIEEFARNKQIIIVLPDGDNSFYTDSVTDDKYYSYIQHELPHFISQLLPISDKPENTYIAGNSMGGYGALKLALTEPEKFGAIGLFSALTQIQFAVENQNEFRFNIPGIFGTNDLLGTEHDIFTLLKNDVENGKKIPPIFSRCGTEDFLLESNHNFNLLANQLQITFDYKETSGAHTWNFWNDAVKEFLDWLPIEDVN